MRPVRTGCAFALTVVLFYSLCTLAAVLWPNAFMGFVGNLFHGADFSRLMSERGDAWSSYFGAVWIMALWAFAFGATFTWLASRFNGRRAG